MNKRFFYVCRYKETFQNGTTQVYYIDIPCPCPINAKVLAYKSMKIHKRNNSKVTVIEFKKVPTNKRYNQYGTINLLDKVMV